MEIPKEDKDKIDRAMKLCESKLRSFFNYLDKNLPEEEAYAFQELILNQTFFAGGVFRSIFTNTPVNDIDIFFKSEEAVLAFKHLVLSSGVKLFSKVTENHSFNFKVPTGMVLSFVTIRPNNPQDMIKDFDFSFNQHFYDMKEMLFSFQRDTFSKIGVVLENVSFKKAVLFRAFRFLNEGFKIESSSLRNLVGELKIEGAADDAIDSHGDNIKEPAVNLTGEFYTQTDYFSQPKKTTIVDRQIYAINVENPNEVSIPVWTATTSG